MKIFKTLLVLGLLAGTAFADTTYYPNGTYLYDGKVKFISENRPMWNNNEFQGLATTNEINKAQGDIEDLKRDFETVSNLVINAEGTGLVTKMDNLVTHATTGLVVKVSALETATNALNTATNALNTRVGALETATNVLNTATNALNTRVGALETATNVLNTATNDLNTRVKTLETADYVHKLNGLTNNVTIVAGENIDITTNKNDNARTVKTWLNTDVAEFSPANTIPTDKYAEQYFTWASGATAGINNLVIPSASGDSVGYLTLYFDQDYQNNKKYDIDNTNGNIS